MSAVDELLARARQKLPRVELWSSGSTVWRGGSTQRGRTALPRRPATISPSW